MSRFWQRVAPAAVLLIAPMLASCGSGQSPSASIAPASSASTSTSNVADTTSAGAPTTTPTNGTSPAVPGSTTSGDSSSGATGGGASSGGVTTTVAPDPQVVALEKLLNDLDTMLAALDKSLASDPAVAP